MGPWRNRFLREQALNITELLSRGGSCTSNESDQVEVMRHSRNLAAHGLQCQMQSAVEHAPNFAIEGSRRTMNFQRTANSGLTDCLSLGVRRTSPLNDCERISAIVSFICIFFSKK